MRYKRLFILIFSIFFSLSSILYASEVEKLMDDFSQKNDLSQKTIDENKGHLVLFTREKLESIHAKTLKDVFKTTPVVYYHENRYSLPDPLSGSSFSPYRSNFIRLYIDGVEITQGWMGSGLLLYGDINIDFADHIEFYYMTPSFETSTEPAYLTIFLYSKDPSQDSGNSLTLMQGDNGYNAQSYSYGDETEDYSYMINLSHTDAKRGKIENGTSTPLSRDFERTQLFGYIKNESQIFHLQLLQKNSDSLAGMSADATPEVSEGDYLNVHMDYGIDFDAYWHAQFAYDWLQTDIRQKDDTLLFSSGSLLPLHSFTSKSKNSTYTAELSYKNSFADHHIMTGIKWRKKQLDSYRVKEIPNIKLSFDSETISSLFFQDQYRLGEGKLLSFGAEYNHIDRNGGIEDDDLWQLRLGYIYAGEHWSYKTYLYRGMFASDPLTISLNTGSTQLTPQTTWGLTQEVAYRDENQSIRLMLLLMKDENGLLNADRSIGTKYFYSVFDYNYAFSPHNKIDLQLYYANYQNIFNIDELEDWSGFFSWNSSYGKFEFFNSLVWHKNSIDYTNYFDLTSAVTWNISENLSLTLKGENLLDKAKKTGLLRIDPVSMTPLTPLEIAPIDRRITLELEYTF